MHLPRLLRRGLAVVGAVLVAGALATPAAADDDPPQVGVDLDEISIAQNVGPDSAGKVTALSIRNTGDEAAHDVVVTIDTTETAKLLQIEVAKPASGCATEQGVITCKLDDVPADTWSYDLMSVRLRVQPGVKVGTVVTPSISISSSNLGSDVSYGSVKVVGSAPDLMAIKPAPVDAKAGEQIRTSVAFTNQGDEAADGVSVNFYNMSPGYLEIVKKIQGCKYAPLPQNYAMSCVFDGQFEPGRTYVMTVGGKAGLPVDVAAATPGPLSYNLWFKVSPGKSGENSDATRRAGAGEGSLHASFVATSPRQPRVKDADSGDNQTMMPVRVGENPADLAAVGGKTSGHVGQSVKLRVGVKNDGPADTGHLDGGDPGHAYVTLPSGTVATSVPDGDYAWCANSDTDWHRTPGRRSYYCSWRNILKPGKTQYLTFTVKIEKSAVGSDGTLVTAAGNIPDRNPKNDHGAITVTVLSGSATPSPSASGSTGTGGQGGSAGGSLPVTGARLGLYGGVGLGVLLAGLGLVVAARRRRVRD
ncbi:hypothetical protein Athai_55400 [Actinocatenispora thailandica]|uniref:Gram-positive cocci surface proteins LPxTG domain-containing protein n=1 Tax=Actinocatenispora thailandica TaxID=227318 RepID=A0A7R7DUF3_9ACTN|nr:hypothetical protein [Actinocatenispora thailandica]BCJ38037.1 hypothetical protein Athai_55400 [Actinocatenispora thailandica]